MRLRPAPATSATSPPRSWRSRLPVIAGGALIAVALSGCMKIDMALDLKSDDTIDGALTFAMTQEVADLSGTSIDELVKEAEDGLLGDKDAPENATVTAYDDGTFIGTTMTFTDAPLATFDDPEGTDGLVVERDGDDFVVTGELDLTDLDSEMMEMVSGPEADVKIAVTFPGKVSDHNGTLDGTTVTWDAKPGEVTELTARGSAVEASSTLLLTLAIATVALLAAIGGALWARSRKRGSNGGPGGAVQAPAAGPYGYAPPSPQGSPQTWAASPPPPGVQQPWGAPQPPAPGGHPVNTGYGPTSTTPQQVPNYAPAPHPVPPAPPAPGMGGYGPTPGQAGPPPPPPSW